MGVGRQLISESQTVRCDVWMTLPASIDPATAKTHRGGVPDILSIGGSPP
ncbi:uncharacterized protein CMC5_002260 [Chondromyces crocatus]|uniref:Uncharacterized protein n=1 Tax=Chondromyces crocatus TaxID=52 RepID=A0A0K1E6D7_CHOCO|nr:uncharacterized protein CMC5_002260 [Chondromyces crocatus]